MTARKNHTRNKLSDNYIRIEQIDLQKNGKTALKVNLLAVALFVILLLAGAPLLLRYESIAYSGMPGDLIQIVILFIAVALYMIFHELTHAAVMKYYGASSVRFGFTGMYAYAGSTQDYFDKYSYSRIALAPVIVWGIIFTILCLALSSEWFALAYMLQISNISGAAGDIYVVFHFRKYPADTWFRDTGVEMSVYQAE